MTLLIFSWYTSLFVLLGEVAVVLARAYSGKDVPGNTPMNFVGFISNELRDLVRIALLLVTRSLPHGRRAATTCFAFEKKLKDLFIERVFGRIAIERGKTSSFFLKHLVEHQESRRGATEEKQGF